MTLKSFADRLCVATLATLFPTVAFAHPETGAATTLAHGFLHPLTGLDHILAMIAVGIVAYQIGGRALWLIPATFVAGMIIGGALGASGVNVPFIELGIALSVVVLGMAISLRVKAPIAAVMGIVGLFAVFHGHAHGTENAGGLSYTIGFVGATALLHLSGIGIGFLIGRIGETRAPAMTTIAGLLMTVTGIGILTQMI